MPETLRFTLEGAAPEDPFHHASHLRAVVLGWIGAADPITSEVYHGRNEKKPYVIGPLWRERDSRHHAFFDVAVLDDRLTPVLLEGADQAEGRVRLGAGQLGLTGPPVTVARAAWEELRGGEAPPASRWRLRLVTPTAHQVPQPDRDLPRKADPAPSPERYFGSWLDRWNRLARDGAAPCAIDERLLDVVATRVALMGFAGETREERFREKATGNTRGPYAERSFVGFVGEVTFGVLKPQTLDPAILQPLNALVRFSAFCGTGVETMRGMGQTELLPSSARGKGMP